MSDSKAVRGPRERGSDADKRTSLPVFYRQVIAELRKVVWPTQEQLTTYFIVVMVFVLFMVGVRLGPRPRLRQVRLLGLLRRRRPVAAATCLPRPTRTTTDGAPRVRAVPVRGARGPDGGRRRADPAHRPAIDQPADDQVEPEVTESRRPRLPTTSATRSPRRRSRTTPRWRSSPPTRTRPTTRPLTTRPSTPWTPRTRPRTSRRGVRRRGARRGRPAGGLPPGALRQAGRLVRGAHLLRHGEPRPRQPREPDLLPPHGGLHPRDRGPDRRGRGDQERPAQDGQAHRAPRLRPGPDGPDRRVLGGRPPHARR